MSAGDPREPGQPDGSPRFFLWIAALVVGAIALVLLFRAFPGQTFSEWNWANLVWLLIILAASSTAILSARHFRFRETARNIAIWGGVIGVLVLGYAYQDELGGMWRRVQSEFLPGGVETEPHVVTLTQQDDGHFYAFADVDGTQVKFLIDTGASDIVLSPADARRAGVDVDSLQYVDGFETANGMGQGAPVRLASIAIGPIRFADVPAVVNRSAMRTSLLGMTFLRRLDGFEFRGRKMLLRWH